MFSKHSLVYLFLGVAGAAFFTHPITATDHIVGANKGWNPGINYTSWANNQTFYVGDYICKFSHAAIGMKYFKRNQYYKKFNLYIFARSCMLHLCCYPKL